MANKKIVILVPGIMGSQLYDGDELIWPGSTGDYAFGYSESKFQKLLKPNLIPQGVIESYYFNQYADIINPLKSMGFQRMSDPHTLPQGNHRGLYIFPYDWRKDNRISANELASFIDRIYHASQNNPLDITLLCHSMGGLVSRYYLESEALKSKKGLEKISQVIFMGTPHRGSTKAFFYLQGERAMLWMDADQVRRLSNHNNPSFSSLYQLLPTIDFPSIYERRGDRKSVV